MQRPFHLFLFVALVGGRSLRNPVTVSSGVEPAVLPNAHSDEVPPAAALGSIPGNATETCPDTEACYQQAVLPHGHSDEVPPAAALGSIPGNATTNFTGSGVGWDSSKRDAAGTCPDTEVNRHPRPSSCGNVKVRQMVDMMNSINQHGITIFPRNGFLLGVVRNGGFLPNENIDADVGILYSDLDKIRSATVRGALGTYSFTVKPSYQHGNWGQEWQGHHPFTWESLPENVAVKLNGLKIATAYFFYPYKDNVVFYPFYRIAGFNLEGGLVEARRYIREGGSASVLGKNEGAFFDSAYGQLGHLFSADDFRTTTAVPFYEYTMDVPAGFGCVLTGYYGKNWRTQIEQRASNYQSHVVGHKDVFEPKSLCR